MSYTYTNFKTKKELKEAVQAWVDYTQNPDLWRIKNGVGLISVEAIFNQKPGIKSVPVPQPVRCYQPGLGPDLSQFTGTVYLEGPHYPKPHRWYAQAKLVDGIAVMVK